MKITKEMFENNEYIKSYFDEKGFCKYCIVKPGHCYSKHDYIDDEKGKWIQCLEQRCPCGY